MITSIDEDKTSDKIQQLEQIDKRERIHYSLHMEKGCKNYLLGKKNKNISLTSHANINFS